MIATLDFDMGSRLLVVVPHPDDETLATGGLIQRALAAGARLRVVIVTDGDDNPWPQRWIEKRWNIDLEARKRWGLRRRAEAITALKRLGVNVEHVRHYGWPDQGLTERLMRDSGCEDRLVAEIENFEPNCVATASLADLHPDHNALGVMVALAISRTIFARCSQLAYVVHGRMATDDTLSVPMSAAEIATKQFALKAHRSQLVLSGTRMAQICKRLEQFERANDAGKLIANEARSEWRLEVSRSHVPWHRYAVNLILETPAEVIRCNVPLPGVSESASVTIAGNARQPLKIHFRRSSDGLSMRLDGAPEIRRIFAKTERLGPRILIYDAAGWAEWRAPDDD